MSTDDLDSGLLGIDLSDSEDDGPKECSQPTTREERNAQSEEDFQKLKSTYRIKVENGEIWKTVQLPLGDTVSKPQAQELVHAVEELYFFRRYGEAAEFIGQVWKEGGGEGGGLDNDTRELLAYYERRCVDRTSVKS